MRKSTQGTVLSLSIMSGFITAFLINLSQLKEAYHHIALQHYLVQSMWRLISNIFDEALASWTRWFIVLGLFIFVVLWSVVFLYEKFLSRRLSSHLSRINHKVRTICVSAGSVIAVLTRGAGIASVVVVTLLNAAVLYNLREGGADTVENPNVVVIVLDALRRDHLGCYGYHEDTSPHIDELARQATLFKTCVTPFPRTTGSAVSFMTGLYPHTHGVRALWVKGEKKNEETLKNLTLAEIARNRDYDVAAFIHHPFLGLNRCFAQGFTDGPTIEEVKGDHEVTRQAISWLEKQERPFFLLLWLLDPHWPYDPPPQDRHALGVHDGKQLQKLLERGEDDNVRAFKSIYNEEEIRLLVSAYDAEIHRSDRKVGEVIAYLKSAGLYDDAIIVVTSDHGESHGEHGFYFEHGEYYYDATALVPLLIKRPRQTAKEIVDHQVRTIDVFPTILAMLNESHPSEGKDLFPDSHEERNALESLMAFGESDFSLFSSNPRRYIDGIAGKWRIARSNRWKLILIPHPEENIFEFYDVQNDPGELNNLIDDPRYEQEIASHKRALFEWLKPEDIENRDGLEIEQIDEDMKKRLRSLGYIQ